MKQGGGGVPGADVIQVVGGGKCAKCLVGNTIRARYPRLHVVRPKLFRRTRRLQRTHAYRHNNASLNADSGTLLAKLICYNRYNGHLDLADDKQARACTSKRAIGRIQPQCDYFCGVQRPNSYSKRSNCNIFGLSSVIRRIIQRVFTRFQRISQGGLLRSIGAGSTTHVRGGVGGVRGSLRGGRGRLSSLGTRAVLIVQNIDTLSGRLLNALMTRTERTLRALRGRLIRTRRRCRRTAGATGHDGCVYGRLFA